MLIDRQSVPDAGHQGGLHDERHILVHIVQRHFNIGTPSLAMHRGKGEREVRRIHVDI